jgi:uncharacterized ion transporter superfamily protein YfcC
MTTPAIPEPRAPRVPDTLVIVGALALAAWAATFLFTPGRFAVAGDPARLMPGSYIAAATPAPSPLFGTGGDVGLLNILFEGLVSGTRNGATIGLMAFLLCVGGAFGVIARTGAIDRLVARSLARGRGGAGLLLALFALFSLAGAVFGLSEEAIALTLILAPALARAGHPPALAVALCYGASQVGFATSWMSPFTVLIAQAIAGLPPLSGLELRAAMWVVFTAAGVLWLALWLRRHPPSPPPGPVDAAGLAPDARAGWADRLILLLVALTVFWVAWGVSANGWFLPEISAQFLALGLAVVAVAAIARLIPDGLSGAAAAFRDGAAQMVPAILVVGLAKGILLLLGGDDPARDSLMNALLDAAAGFTALLPEWLTAWGMLIVQSGINFLITSGSGQAAVTMPLMAPLADLSGVTRQTAVLAYQLGAGLTDLIAPTSASLMGCLAAARVEFGQWLRFVWKPVLALYALASAFVIGAHALGYN